MKRKKKLQRLVSILLALIMALGVCGTSFAASTLTITGLTGDTAAHDYTAYQIFTGDYDSTNKVLSNVVWGDGVNVTSFVSALKASDVEVDDQGTTLGSLITTALTDITDETDNSAAKAIAEILQQFADTTSDYYAYYDDVAIEVAALAAANKNGSGSGSGEVSGTSYVISGLEDGYYVVIDTTASLGDNDAYSRYILQVVGDTEIKTKKGVPEDTKTVTDEDGNDVEANTVTVGDTVGFKITSAVPDYTGYDYYYFVINDTLSDGLEFDSDSVVVTITAKTTNTTTTLIKDTDYYVYTDDDASPYTFRIAFKDIMEYTIGDAIVVTYSATLTEEAESGLSGNSNSSSITYSNDPTDSGKGDNEPEPGLPDSDVPTGVTPESITLTFTTGITITKVDENGAELSGATFTLTGTSTQYVLKGGTYFEIDNTNGTYWLLTDGTYTTTSPDTAGINTTVYVTNSSGEYDKYTKTYASTSGAVAKNVYLTATSGSDGIVTFSTLGEGTYTITETEAPSGYNTADPVTVVITLDGPTTVSTGNEEAEWSYDGSSSDVSVDSNGNYIITIMDQKGSSLPSTGGTGTTIFYVVGIVLMLGVAVVLVTKKRIGSDK